MKSKTWIVALSLAATVALVGCAASGEQWKGYISTTENVTKIRPGTTTAMETEQLLGAPLRVSHDGRRNWDYWEYRSHRELRRGTLWIGISSDGVVREVIQIPDKETSGAA